MAKASGYKFQETKISIQDLKNQNYQNYFITSTSTKILPITTVYLNHQRNNLEIENLQNLEKIELNKPSDELKNLMKLYDEFLS